MGVQQHHQGEICHEEGRNEKKPDAYNIKNVKVKLTVAVQRVTYFLLGHDQPKAFVSSWNGHRSRSLWKVISCPASRLWDVAGITGRIYPDMVILITSLQRSLFLRRENGGVRNVLCSLDLVIRRELLN